MQSAETTDRSRGSESSHVLSREIIEPRKTMMPSASSFAFVRDNTRSLLPVSIRLCRHPWHVVDVPQLSALHLCLAVLLYFRDLTDDLSGKGVPDLRLCP